jgi:uncharacterized protein YndB with AHSA1/START domain
MSRTRSHVAEIVTKARPEDLFAALVTPSAIRAWWGAARAIVLPTSGGLWAATWGAVEDEPDYVTVARIATYEPPRTLVLDDYRYLAKSGPLPFRAEFRTRFDVGADGKLVVTQEGFPCDPIADDFYRGCEVGWKTTLAQLKRFVER